LSSPSATVTSDKGTRRSVLSTSRDGRNGLTTTGMRREAPVQ